MLGRKQSIRVDIMVTDYVQDESLNENAEIDWVNKVNLLDMNMVVKIRMDSMNLNIIIYIVNFIILLF